MNTQPPLLKLVSTWNNTICTLPKPHLLQTEEWGAFKQRRTGWQPEQILFRDAQQQVVGAALVLTRHFGPLSVMYVPKGPILNYQDVGLLRDILSQLERLARYRRAIWLKIDPDVPLATGEPNTADDKRVLIGENTVRVLQERGWRFSDSQVQFRNTLVIDLTKSEEELLAAMGQGKRRKVRYGPRHGVTVRSATMDDLPLLYQLYAETGQRDGFLTRPYEYYVDEWGTMLQAGLAHVLIATVEGRPVAHVILFHFGKTCWYFTGASVSDPELRRLMPADLLQWEAMRWAKANGYTVYDMYGIPNDFTPDDPMWGVYQFKRDFGGTVVRHIGAWDYAPYGWLYWLYTQVMPQVLGMMRRLRGHPPSVSQQSAAEPHKI